MPCSHHFHNFPFQALNSPNPPPEFRKLYKAGTFKHHQEYSADRLKFGALHSLFDTAISVASLCYGYYPLTWNASGSLIALLGLSGEIPQTIAWVLLLTAVGTVLGLPWSVYKTFVLEAKHEFNKTTPRTFVLDIIKTVG